MLLFLLTRFFDKLNEYVKNTLNIDNQCNKNHFYASYLKNNK